MSLSLGEIRKCGDLDDAINALIEKKVEAILFYPFVKQKLFFEKDLKIATAPMILDWGLINEAYQRRNVLVHNDGIVNRRYLTNVMGGGEKLKEGDRLAVDKSYLVQVDHEFLASGIVLTQNCWRKWFENDILNADSTLLDVIDKELMQREYAVAEKLGLYCRDLKMGTEKGRWDANLLFCQTLRRLDKNTDFENEIRKLEGQLLSEGQMTDLAAVKGDRKAFYEHAEKAAIIGEKHSSDFISSAVYEEIYKDEDFRDRLDEIFKDGVLKKWRGQLYDA
jgi:hypothetical protein